MKTLMIRIWHCLATNSHHCHGATIVQQSYWWEETDILQTDSTMELPTWLKIEWQRQEQAEKSMTVNIVCNQLTHCLTTQEYELRLVTIKHQEKLYPMLALWDPMLSLGKCTETDILTGDWTQQTTVIRHSWWFYDNNFTTETESWIGLRLVLTLYLLIDWGMTKLRKEMWHNAYTNYIEICNMLFTMYANWL